VRAQAALDEPERRNAIHGLVRWLPWTLQTRHQNQLSLRLQLHPSPGYPFSLLLELEYHVGREGLTVTTKARSLEESLIPFGLGFHPYLTAGTETIDGAILQVPGRHTLDVDDRGLPTGALTPVEGTDRDFISAKFVGPAVLDTAYTTLERDEDGRAWAALDAPGGAAGASLWVDPGFPYLMVYTGDTLPEVPRRRRAVAIEPMTCPPNALRTGKDIVDLQPDQEWSARWGIVPR
jgi:aldose 1-epimerase